MKREGRRVNLKKELRDGITYDYLMRVRDLHIEDDTLHTYCDGLAEGVQLALDFIERALRDEDEQDK